MSTLWYIALLAISSIVSVVVGAAAHEFGHLIFGKIAGFRFVSLRLFRFVWYMQNGALSFSVSPGFFASGQCQMDPPEIETRRGQVLYAIGGSLVNFGLGLLAIAIVIATDAPRAVGFFLLCFGVGNIILALMNIVPFSRLYLNDGMILVQALESLESLHAAYILQRINAELSRGSKLADIPEEFCDLRREVVSGRNLSILQVVLLIAARDAEVSDPHAYGALLHSLDFGELPGPFAEALRVDLLYYSLVTERDLDAARRLYETKGIKRMLQIRQASVLRTRAACEGFLDGKQDVALATLKRAYGALPGLASKGAMLSEKDELDRLTILLLGLDTQSADSTAI